MSKYDYLVVGSGLFGAVFVQQAASKGKKCLVVERRNHIGGNCFTKKINDIDVHCYGAHIFHTSNLEVWDYVNKFAKFNNFINSPIANYKGRLFNLPFNMNTFYRMWGVVRPDDAERIINEQRQKYGQREPANLEEQAISLVGKDIYEILIKGYTEKQWGRSCSELPASIIKRLPVRFTFDNNYFNDRFQGIPDDGYTEMVRNMLGKTDLYLNTDYVKDKKYLRKMADKVIYTGAIDEYFEYALGALSYRTVEFETEVLSTENHQGVAVMNYTDRNVPYTRVIEHKHFNNKNQNLTIISKEYPSEWDLTKERYYPVNDEKNNTLFAEYCKMAKEEKGVFFGGRLGAYRYYDMDKVIAEALDLSKRLVAEE